MGAHTDMWNPRALTWSSLVEKLGWKRKLAPLRPAFDALGPIMPALAERLGLILRRRSSAASTIRAPRCCRI